MLLGFTGVARSGKDSCANILVSQFGFTKLGFADGVRDMAAAIDPFVHTGQNRHFTEGDTPFARYSDTLANLGYEDAKQCADVRRLLQRIGTEAGRQVFGEGAWVSLACDRILALEDNGQTNVVLSDVRFPNEAAAIKGLGGYVIRVLRPGYDNGLPALHPSEALTAELEVDATISATNLDELEVELKQVYAKLREIDASDALIEQQCFNAPHVYLAGPWAHKADVTAAKAQLIAAGINVISTWTEQSDADEANPETFTKHALSDWDEVNRADVLVLLNLKKSDGKASEMGAALAMGKRVIVVGERVGNIFYFLPQVERVDTLDQVIRLLVNGLTPEEDAMYAVLADKYEGGDPGVVVEYMKNTTEPLRGAELNTVSYNETAPAPIAPYDIVDEVNSK